MKGKKTENQIKSLASFSVIPAYFYVLRHPKIWSHLFSYLKTVIKDFFWLQFSVKLNLKKIKIINVDHELDQAVPFLSSKIDTYLDFVNFWVRPLTLVTKRCKQNATKYFCEYLDYINKCYADAADFYKFRMSTTDRPKGFVSFQYCTIQLLDPHYLCVPSLHVSVLVLAYAYFKKVLNENDFSKEEIDFYTNELYLGAIEIAETVLYVKQHSVNCIAAALYMMNFILENHFSIQDAVDFINDMFKNTTDIEPQKKEEINAHLNYLFEQLLLEGKNEYDWLAPLKRWILRYEAEQNK